MLTAKHEPDFATLRNALAQFPHGATLEQLRAVTALPISERTLIRRLAQMVENGSVRKEGQSRATRYVLVTMQGFAEDGPSTLTQRDASVPVRAGGAEVLSLVSRPLALRKAVGYNRSFLSSYRPNRSSYLSAVDKARLEAISKTVDTADPRAGTYAQRILNRLLID